MYQFKQFVSRWWQNGILELMHLIKIHINIPGIYVSFIKYIGLLRKGSIVLHEPFDYTVPCFMPTWYVNTIKMIV